MAYRYEAQRFSINGDVLKGVFSNNQVASVLIQLVEEEDQNGKTGNLVATIFSADSADKRIGNVQVDWENWRTVLLDNAFTERNVYITRAMYEEVLVTEERGHPVALKIEYMRFTPQKFKNDEHDHQSDLDKDFVGYRVFIKRKKGVKQAALI